MTLRAYAKINIGLHILGKRGDGYHDIETVFREIGLADEIGIEPADEIEFICTSDHVPSDGTNVCVKAARLLRDRHAAGKGARIVLHKHIPVGAGLGGGSSDAAAVLTGLNDMWSLHLDTTTLRQIGVQIGSDVPFFIEGGSAYGLGRGEILERLRLEVPSWIVLIVPPVHVSTSWAYRHLVVHRDHTPTGLRDEVLSHINRSHEMTASVVNDFEESVFQQYPIIRDVKKGLLHAGASFALMSGSGSSVFGLFDDEATARLAAGSFPQDHIVSLTPPHFESGRT